MVHERARIPDRLIAASLVAALAALYLSNGTIAPTHDASSSVYLAANVLREGRFWFTASRDPLLFSWSLRARPGGPFAPVHLASFDTVMLGAPARAHYQAGNLVPSPSYAIVPSSRTDPATGERLYVSLYGPGAGLSAAPVLAVVEAAGRDLDHDPWWLWQAAKAAASLLAAASAAFVYLTCRRWLGVGPSLAVAVVYGLGTALWSMTSQTLWQHGPNTFFLALGTWLLLRDRDLAPAPLALCGLALSAATACRPTSAFYVAVVAIWLLSTHRRGALAFLAGAAPVGVLLAAYNGYFVGTPFRSAQAAYAGSFFTGSFPEALAGLLVSPSRGLFVFSPFLLLAIPGAAAAWRRAEYAALRPLSVAAVLVVLLHAAWPAWWGGWGYGYRIIADLAATLSVLLVPVVPWVLERRARTVVLAAACAWAIVLQAVGAFAYDSDWNSPTAFWIHLPSGPAYFTTREEAEEAARRNGLDRIQGGQVSLDTFHGVLWSVSESQPAVYLGRLAQSREKQVAQTAWWIDQWR